MRGYIQMVNKPLAVAMYLQGFGLTDIGREFGVSRQRVWQIIKREYQPLLFNGLQKKNIRATSVMPRPEEKYVMRQLQKRGLEPRFLGYNLPADIAIGEKTIQVKYRRKPSHHKGTYFHFNFLTEKEKPDFYIFVCGNLVHPICFIVSGQEINSDSLSVPDIPKSKKTKRFYRKYKDNWAILK